MRQQKQLSLVESASFFTQEKVLVATLDRLADVDWAKFDHLAAIIIGQSVHNGVHKVRIPRLVV